MTLTVEVSKRKRTFIMMLAREIWLFGYSINDGAVAGAVEAMDHSVGRPAKTPLSMTIRWGA